jgi:hypothetical protein
MRDRKEKIEYLLQEIGEIDDKLLNEAITYKPSRVKSYRLGLIAACLALACFLSVALPFMRNISNITGEKEEVSKVPGLDGVLLLNSTYTTNLTDVESISSFGLPRLVWQDTESGVVSVCTLSKSEFARLQSEMGKGREVGEASPQLNCLVWVIDGEGRVKSPYLKDTPGNEGATVFYYDAEIMPTDRFIDYVSDILS